MRLVAASAVVLVLAAPACSDTSDASGCNGAPVISAARPERAQCLYRDVFAALDEVRGVRALCPSWLPAGVRPASIYASDEPRYVVELHPLGKLFPHVVLELSRDEPPGRRIGETTVRGKGATIYFNAPSDQPGLHSGHYLVVFPGDADQQGSYWVSVHERSQRSCRWNVDRLLQIARSLQPIR